MTVTSTGADFLSLYQRIQEDARPESIVIDGRQYTTRRVHPVHRPVPDEPLQVSTLESIAGYFNSSPDKVEPSSRGSSSAWFRPSRCASRARFSPASWSVRAT